MITARDFLTLADVWSRGRTEAEWRCAVSRAYYATFHECRAVLARLGFSVPRADLAHAFLWRRLENSKIPKLVSVGSDLGALRRERNQSDYDLHTTVTQSTALRAVTSATKLIQVLDCVSPDEWNAATETMRAYERDVLREHTWRNRPR